MVTVVDPWIEWRLNTQSSGRIRLEKGQTMSVRNRRPLNLLLLWHFNSKCTFYFFLDRSLHHSGWWKFLFEIERPLFSRFTNLGFTFRRHYHNFVFHWFVYEKVCQLVHSQWPISLTWIVILKELPLCQGNFEVLSEPLFKLGVCQWLHDLN